MEELLSFVSCLSVGVVECGDLCGTSALNAHHHHHPSNAGPGFMSASARVLWRAQVPVTVASKFHSWAFLLLLPTAVSR